MDKSVWEDFFVVSFLLFFRIPPQILQRKLIDYICRPTEPSTYSAETKSLPWELPHFCVVVTAVPDLLSRVGNPLLFALGNKGFSLFVRLIIGRCHRFQVRRNVSADIIKGIPFLDASLHCRTIRIGRTVGVYLTLALSRILLPVSI